MFFWVQFGFYKIWTGFQDQQHVCLFFLEPRKSVFIKIDLFVFLSWFQLHLLHGWKKILKIFFWNPLLKLIFHSLEMYHSFLHFPKSDCANIVCTTTFWKMQDRLNFNFPTETYVWFWNSVRNTWKNGILQQTWQIFSSLPKCNLNPHV